MSFYISENLKGRITEKELVEDNPGELFEVENSSKLGLTFVFDEVKSFNPINQLEKLSEAEIHVTMNLNIESIEKIFFKKLAVKEIVIGSTRKDILKYELLDIKKNFDDYQVRLLINVLGEK